MQRADLFRSMLDRGFASGCPDPIELFALITRTGFAIAVRARSARELSRH
jgi:hypothetical protein